MSLPNSFAQTTVDFPLDDNDTTGSEMYATARSSFTSSEDEGHNTTPRAHSISLHLPSSFRDDSRETSRFLTPMSVPTNDVGVTPPPEQCSGQSTPRAGQPPYHDDDDDDAMHEEDSLAVRLHLDGEERAEYLCNEDDDMDGQDPVETHHVKDKGRAVRQRWDYELTSGSLRREVTYWKEVSQYRKGQNKELKKQYAEAVSRWQMIQKQNDLTIGKLQEQTTQLMEFMNSSWTATTSVQESELRGKVQAEEARIVAQHQAIQGAHAQVMEKQAEVMEKQAEQDRMAEGLREREALLVQREAAVEKNRTEVENQQASVSRLLQQAKVEAACLRNVAPEMRIRPPTSSSTQTTLPRPDLSHLQHPKNKAGLSTRMFLTAMPEPDGSDSDDDAPPAAPRMGTRLSTGHAIGNRVEVHTLTMDQLMEAIRRTMHQEMADTVKSKVSPRHHCHRSVTSGPESEPEVDRETRIELLRCVRELYKKQCKIESDKDWHGHQEADRTAVEAYNTSGEGAPSLVNIRFDMRTSGNNVSPWNFVIFEHLFETFKADNATFIIDNRITDRYINDLIEDKFSRGRQTWRGGQPKVKPTGTLETPEECEARVLLADERLKERARADTRRRNKFERRHATVKKVIALHVGNPKSDVAVWRFLERVLDLLGPNSMSSEDTCDDVSETVFRVKVLEWRRPIDEHMEIIDKQRVLDRDLFSRQGSRPGKRLRDGAVKSTREPVRRLPQQLYNPSWLKAQNAHQVHTLAVSSEKFDWIRVVATLAHTM